uniref:Immunoglobulin V-set domain-containing protein n=1 Tax=Periophthalmus magnuspinnatus TaxID=409849 RepID=A0A3B4AQV3_9GOBI
TRPPAPLVGPQGVLMPDKRHVSETLTQSPRTISTQLGQTVSVSCTASRGVGSDLSCSRASDTPSHYSSSGSQPDFTLTISGLKPNFASYLHGKCSNVEYYSQRNISMETKRQRSSFRLNEVRFVEMQARLEHFHVIKSVCVSDGVLWCSELH